MLVHDDGRVIGMGYAVEPSIWSTRLPPRTERHTVFDTVDGVTVCATLYEGELVLWTHDAIDGAVIDSVREYVAGWKPRPDTTVLFSAVLGFVPRVVDYEGFEGLVLLGQVEHETGIDWTHPDDVASATGWWGETAVERTMPTSMVLQLIGNAENGENRRGFTVVYPRQTGPSLRFSAPFKWYDNARGG